MRFALLLLMICGSVASAATPVETAAKIDAILKGENYGDADGGTAEVARLCDDTTYLRRISLDIIGELPSPDDIAKFNLDPSPEKRAKAVERLLANPLYGQNWARYWRDVIYYRRSDERANVGQNATTVYLIEQFNKNAAWDKIARSFITATGDVTDNGECGLIFAQMADPNNVAAEVSRIFMGVQIQCAQCHDHKSDRWKREQFHELAAFFPRIGVRPTGKRMFEVVSLVRNVPKRSPADTEGAKIEHYMPDLQNPEADGTLMTPIFYATGGKLKVGASDAERRGKLAEWITSAGNHWFSRAMVNRMWGEMLGHGFQEPLDDLGPDRTPIAPKTFDYLEQQFAQHNYDVKWLIRTIAATEAYARESRPRQDNGHDRFAASCTNRLRADQLFNALTSSLGIDENLGRSKQFGPKGALRAMNNSPRGKMEETFGYDPSEHRDEVALGIPQALWLMNSPELNRHLNGRNAGTSLGELLEKTRDDKAVLDELYLRTLAREPNAKEKSVALAHVKQSANRDQAFEDINWALLNSTEFLNRK